MNTNLVKSPLNYTGGKYKLLPQILPHIPNNINTFYDLFCGAANVGCNIKAKKVMCNDIEPHLIRLLRYLRDCNPDTLIRDIDKVIDKYGLSNTFINGYEYYGCGTSEGLSKYNKP